MRIHESRQPAIQPEVQSRPVDRKRVETVNVKAELKEIGRVISATSQETKAFNKQLVGKKPPTPAEVEKRFNELQTKLYELKGQLRHIMENPAVSKKDLALANASTKKLGSLEKQREKMVSLFPQIGTQRATGVQAAKSYISKAPARKGRVVAEKTNMAVAQQPTEVGRVASQQPKDDVQKSQKGPISRLFRRLAHKKEKGTDKLSSPLVSEVVEPLVSAPIALSIPVSPIVSVKSVAPVTTNTKVGATKLVYALMESQETQANHRYKSEAQIEILKDLRQEVGHKLKTKQLGLLDGVIANLEEAQKFELQSELALSGLSQAALRGEKPLSEKDSAVRAVRIYQNLWGGESAAFADYMKVIGSIQVDIDEINALLDGLNRQLGQPYSQWAAEKVQQPKFREIEDRAKANNATFNAMTSQLGNSRVGHEFTQRATRIPLMLDAIIKELPLDAVTAKRVIADVKTNCQELNNLNQLYLEYEEFSSYEKLSSGALNNKLAHMKPQQIADFLGRLENRLPTIKTYLSEGGKPSLISFEGLTHKGMLRVKESGLAALQKKMIPQYVPLDKYLQLDSTSLAETFKKGGAAKVMAQISKLIPVARFYDESKIVTGNALIDRANLANLQRVQDLAGAELAIRANYEKIRPLLEADEAEREAMLSKMKDDSLERLADRVGIDVSRATKVYKNENIHPYPGLEHEAVTNLIRQIRAIWEQRGIS